MWHAYFGLPGSLNDINVLGSSPLFEEVCLGHAPRVKYHVNSTQYGQCYYLVDGIYPKWATFVQAIRSPRSPPEEHFTKMQESYRKDVERAFGILQARFAIIRGPARGWSKENLQFIMMTCIILNNMIVEDEHDEMQLSHLIRMTFPPDQKRHIYMTKFLIKTPLLIAIRTG